MRANSAYPLEREDVMLWLPPGERLGGPERQSLERAGRQRNGAAGASGGFIPPERQAAAGEIYILPLQAPDCAIPRGRLDRQNKERVKRSAL